MPLVVLLPVKAEVRQDLYNYKLAKEMFFYAVNTVQIDIGGKLPPRHFVFPRTPQMLETLGKAVNKSGEPITEGEFRAAVSWLCERWWKKTAIHYSDRNSNGKYAPMTVYELLPNPYVFIFYPDAIKAIYQTNQSIQKGIEVVLEAVFTSNLNTKK